MSDRAQSSLAQQPPEQNTRTLLANGVNLLLEEFFIFLFLVEPILAAVRLKISVLEVNTHLADRNGRYDLSRDDLVGYLAMRPKVDGTKRVL